MSFQSKQGIVPQLNKCIGVVALRLFTIVLPASFLVLTACSTVQLQASKPQAPNTLEQARAYVAERDRQLEFLEYELNEQSRACYKKFFVSSCLDEVRLQGAQIRRAHLEVQGKAEDMIRLDEYANRRARTPN
ncbi:MAG: hypothetical protein A0129_11580 [Limnobacter sp. CACIAM 66H1]|jgi:hypothetical protein|uniref:hypothetical protein n=1 Tax=unclassified Limnobacter TaxID=2630203 RepID=UPI0007A85C92|nr:hypothetical protein [Limnobacter sp. CACIAM 66H1]KYP10693.1 MAG: hypothetical protein A0129_11580 [Limnobacter sp. CACIAM 66H1]